MIQPTFRFERRLWRSGKTYVAGIDEVGRGALAGPLVVAAVIFSQKTNAKELLGINDSKLLSPQKRLRLVPLIKKATLHHTTASVSVADINRLGIARATFKAMRLCLSRLPYVDHVLVDAFYIPYLKGLRRKNQTAITKGDQKSLSIAAASILAKVHRDQLMTNLHRQFPHYHWAQNKGYGTLSHRLTLAKHGPTRHHRKAFIKNLLIENI